MKILVLTAVYPRNDVQKVTAATKVVHYFAEQWKNKGHDVFVVHTAGKSFKLFHMLPQKIKDVIKTKSGIEIGDLNITRKCEYEFEEIPVFRRPVFKGIPHALPSKRAIRKIGNDIRQKLEEHGFEPELIVSHWASPNVQLLAELDQYYSCKKSVVFHGTLYLEALKNQWKPKLTHIDAIGCRSITLANTIKEELGLEKLPFVCASGVPDKYLHGLSLDVEKFDQPLNRFIYVGELISRKYCSTVIQALTNSGRDDWHLDVVGIGGEMDNLLNLVKTLGVEDRVTFHGRVPRDSVIDLMKRAQCFIMPSKREAFGLVYLEAMACSCVTVGSKKEGIDGIINHGENGMLVSAGSVDELEQTLQELYNMDVQALKSLAEKGYKTANQYSDSAVAECYLNDVLAW